MRFHGRNRPAALTLARNGRSRRDSLQPAFGSARRATSARPTA